MRQAETVVSRLCYKRVVNCQWDPHNLSEGICFLIPDSYIRVLESMK